MSKINKTTKPSTTTEDVKAPEIKLTGLEVRTAILAAAEKHGVPFVPVTGNTYPQKGLIWVHGGHWDKEAKCQMVPATYAEQMQKAVDELDAKIQANIAKRKAKQASSEAVAA